MEGQRNPRKRTPAWGWMLSGLPAMFSLLAFYSLLVGSGPHSRSKNPTVEAHLTTLQNAVDLYRRDTGQWPATLKDVLEDTGPSGYDGPYIRAVPRHPWGGTYSLESGTVTATPGYYGRATATAASRPEDYEPRGVGAFLADWQRLTILVGGALVALLVLGLSRWLGKAG